MKIFLLLAAILVLQADQTGAIRDRLDRYLSEYEPQLSALVAQEDMTQRMKDRWVVTHRRIQSEVAFIALPGNAGWMGFRRVVKANGKAIKDRGVPLQQLLQEGTSDDYDQARLLLADSAAHNLGAPRTINLPNLPLELLHPRHRHRFTQELYAREKIRGTPTAVLRFEEISTPTIIRQAATVDQRGDLKTIVSAWIEPDTGRLLRAHVYAQDVRLGVNSFVAEIRVEFKADEDLGMLVPAEMQEKFFVGANDAGDGVAKYSNFRRFQTTARIVPQ